MATYLVTADHVCERFACIQLPVTVKQYAGTNLFYATAPGYGCGRNYRSEREAIYGLFLASACTNIRIEESN